MTDNSNNTPRLRFPGFTGEWVEKPMPELCRTITPTHKLQSSNYLAHGQYRVVDQSQSLICGWTNDPKGVIENLPVIIFGDHTCALKYIDFPFVQGADGVKILSTKKGYDTRFVFQSFLANPVVQDGYKRHFSVFREKKYFITINTDEQQKIAEFLSEIDALISAQAEKVDALKVHKKGLMQQLFPQQDETTPRLRFPGFAGEWEEKLLGFVARKINRRNSNLEVSRVFTNSANAGIVDQNEYFDRDIAVKENTHNYHIVIIDDFVYNPRISTAAPVGPISVNKIGKGIMSPLYTVFRFMSGCVSFYEQYFQTSIWHQYLKNVANYGARFDRMNITSDDFFKMPLLLPSIAEQQKIAECLSEMDALISAQEQRVELLKAHKKGLMQQLFPQSDK
ncbi:MAG: restriction endonuclease subunit S [Bacteroidaceae bacterium]|nr:restriction endonuclease subunit S [Bacteroidaceae bacterium]